MRIPALCTASLLAVPAAAQAAPEASPDVLNFPAAYRVEAEGTVAIDDIEVPGRIRMDYLVYPDGRVVIPYLSAWVDDIDVVITFLWWEVAREQLRCTSFTSTAPIVGALSGTDLYLDADAVRVSGLSYYKREGTGPCRDEARAIDASNNRGMGAVHDPQNDRFALSGAFSAEFDGNRFEIGIEAAGSYINRPPVALLGVADPGVLDADIPQGCPIHRRGDPPIVFANTADGFLAQLKSMSYDPDGLSPPDGNPKLPRADLSFEQWAHSDTGEKFRYLGDGRLMEPVLFETGRAHYLLLTVTDRNGARARKLCHFEVR